MPEFSKYEQEIAQALQEILNCDYGDAIGVVDCNSFYVRQGWSGSATPVVVAEKIAAN